MLPEHTKNDIDNYVSKKYPPGDFLYAVLTNDLFEAVARADDINLYSLIDIIKYIYNDVPSTCWGSPEAVAEWLDGRAVIEHTTMLYIITYMNRIYLGEEPQKSMVEEIGRLLTKAGITEEEQEEYWDFYQKPENRTLNERDEAIDFKPFVREAKNEDIP